MSSRQNRPSPDGSSGDSPAAGGTDPSAATGGPSIRRALALGSGSADPGRLLPTPAALPSTNTARGESASEETTRPLPGTSPGAAAAVLAEPGNTSGTTTQEAAGTAASQRPEPEASEGTSTRAQATGTASAAGLGAAAPDAEGAGAAAPDAEGAGAAPDAAGEARGEDEPPPGNPKKPLLAAAGIAGVVLLAVPLLIWATDDSGQKDDKAQVTVGAEAVVDDEAMNAPQGDYAAAKPTAEGTKAKPSAKASAKASPEASAKAKSQSGQTSSKVALVPPPPPPVQEKPTDAATTAVTPKRERAALPPNTAGYAVQQLAAESPGRHICYRVYVGTGWQKPVCDGVTAGTEGKPIKGINIAAAGMSGASANGWVQGVGWTTQWTGAKDGLDFSIGSSGSGAPNLGALAIKAGSGVVCQNARISAGGWGGLGCSNLDGSRPYAFGGSMAKSHWIDGVRLTV